MTKSYTVKVLLGGGTTQQYDTFYLRDIIQFFANSGYYYFKNEKGLGRYFPIERTVVIEEENQ